MARISNRPEVFAFLCFSMAASLAASGQPITFGPQRVISTSASAAQSVFAADLDGDGDIDVLSASAGDDKIAWYENLGAGAFGPERVITTLAATAVSVFAADLDGDGNIDVLSASEGDYKIAWYENTDGRGAFGPQRVTSTFDPEAVSVFGADLDGDGDVDVLFAAADDNMIAWQENLVAGVFGPHQVITTLAEDAASVFAADLDGDGDIDVLSASEGDNKIAWYENLLAGVFGHQRTITTLADGAQSVFAADLDGDGDIDVLSASAVDGKIAWYENTDGQGAFGPQRVITTSAGGARSVFAADLDGDGDTDVLSASDVDGKIAWYENTDGQGAFGPQRVISTLAERAASVFAADLDGDGNLDVLSASQADNKIAWYQNLMELPPLRGDLSGDGQLGLDDVQILRDYLLGSVQLNQSELIRADSNADGKIDVADLIYLQLSLE